MRVSLVDNTTETQDRFTSGSFFSEKTLSRHLADKPFSDYFFFRSFL
jgi:hypothetical protein